MPDAGTQNKEVSHIEDVFAADAAMYGTSRPDQRDFKKIVVVRSVGLMNRGMLHVDAALG